MNSIKTDNYWSFWCQGWSNHQNQEVLWWNRAFEAVEAIEAAEADEVNEVAVILRPKKSLLRTPESWGFLNSVLFWCFETKNIIEESWNIILNFSTFHVGGCWGQLMLLFWKLVQETQMSTPPEATRHHISTQLLVLLHLRAIYFSTFQYETPCNNPIANISLCELRRLKWNYECYFTKVRFQQFSPIVIRSGQLCIEVSMYLYFQLVQWIRMQNRMN